MTTISDRIQSRLDNATNKAERAYLLGLLVTARKSETAAANAARMNAADGRTRPRMVDDVDVATDRREAAAEEAAQSTIRRFAS